MIATIQKSLSVVSLLLMAGTGLIIAEGPLTNSSAVALLTPAESGLVPDRKTQPTMGASVSVIYGVTPSGQVDRLKVACSAAPLRSVARANGSVATADVTVAADKP